MFGLVGVLNTSIDFGLFWAITAGTNAGVVAANVVGFTVGATNSYWLNSTVTFAGSGTQTRSLAQFWRFAAVTLALLLLSTATVALLRQIMPNLAAKAVSIIVVFAGGYGLNRLYVFRDNGLARRS
jgi:putative flippase GtrA